MKKVLVFGMTENPGGVESVIMNYYRNIDHQKIHFDFLCNSHNPIAFEDELKQSGSKCFHFVARSKKPLQYCHALNTFFRQYAPEYDAIWVNVCSLANIDYLKLARKYGISRRIIHSHNSENMDSALRGQLHKFNKKRISKYATDFWACSEDAAKWFFEGETLKNTVIVNNAIDITKMRFDANKRKSFRKQLAVEDKLIIGNIGRLHFQKNQDFIIDIFSALIKKEPNAVLFLIGQGEDESKLKTKVKNLHLEKSVYLLGVQQDIQGWLSAMDLFLFPSRFEGLSVVAMEAQANGVPVLASKNVIPAEVKINENFQFYGLEHSAAEWADQIVWMSHHLARLNSEKILKSFMRKNFEIKQEAKKLQDWFLKNEY
ncbi:glycosyltransferase family 1 protein [Pseudoramibacter faecis]|uniref:glycosyltransferase family 1 protein n=1 Tax=Pseudoramibacter faecis TaxID=3108534 RepID=UPI002E788E5C|nr:glycosyltransferase family 1 protein [Pseudoramibacter sp. HA2172]